MIYYVSRTLNDAQLNYTTTEKKIFGSCICLGEIMKISTRVQNNSVHRSFYHMIFDAKEGR